MRVFRIILIVFAVFFILVNALSYMAYRPEQSSLDAQERVGYIFGRNIFFIIGIFLLVAARHIGKKIKEKEREQMVDSLFEEEADKR